MLPAIKILKIKFNRQTYKNNFPRSPIIFLRDIKYTFFGITKTYDEPNIYSNDRSITANEKRILEIRKDQYLKDSLDAAQD